VEWWFWHSCSWRSPDFVWERHIVFRELQPLPSVSDLAGTFGAALVVFQARDCEEQAAFIESWNALRQDGGFNVVGIPLDHDLASPRTQEAISLLAPGLALQPQAREAARRMMAGFGATRTPAVIVVNAAGQPRIFIPLLQLPGPQLGHTIS
jgi:hypothetical protein